MAVILTGTEYIDLDAHGAALDIRQRPLAFYAELNYTATEIMLPFSHGRAAGGIQEWALFVNITSDGRVTARWENSGGALTQAQYISGTNNGNLHRMLAVARGAAANTFDLYVDGSLRDSTGLGGDLDTANLNNLTRIGMDPAGPGFFFVGEISNVALWDVEIADADAQDLTAGTITPGDLLSGIVEWWPLDFDARGAVNELDGTPVGSPSFTETPPGGAIEVSFRSGTPTRSAVTADTTTAAALRSATPTRSTLTLDEVAILAFRSVTATRSAVAAATPVTVLEFRSTTGTRSVLIVTVGAGEVFPDQLTLAAVLDPLTLEFVEAWMVDRKHGDMRPLRLNLDRDLTGVTEAKVLIARGVGQTPVVERPGTIEDVAGGIVAITLTAQEAEALVPGNWLIEVRTTPTLAIHPDRDYLRMQMHPPLVAAP